MIYPLNPPLLEMLILSILKKGDSYGYLISQQLKDVSNLKDSALYPVLKRLSENGYVEVYDQQFQGRNRKYYRITQAGILQYEMLREEWNKYCNNIEKIMNGEKSGEGMEETGE